MAAVEVNAVKHCSTGPRTGLERVVRSKDWSAPSGVDYWQAYFERKTRPSAPSPGRGESAVSLPVKPFPSPALAIDCRLSNKGTPGTSPSNIDEPESDQNPTQADLDTTISQSSVLNFASFMVKSPRSARRGEQRAMRVSLLSDPEGIEATTRDADDDHIIALARQPLATFARARTKTCWSGLIKTTSNTPTVFSEMFGVGAS